MTYRWSLEGPAFEFPTPYGTENGFLVWRGYGLIALALLIVLVVSFVGSDKAESTDILLGTLSDKTSVVPHLVGAMLLTALGALDLLQAAARRTLLLAPGQPASLMPEVAREASGASPAAATLQRLLEVGTMVTTEPGGPYAGWLHALTPKLATAPPALPAFLRHRLAHSVLAGGLAVLLVMAVGVVRQPQALALVSLTMMAVCGLVLVRHLLFPSHGAAPPWVVGCLLALVVAVGGVLVGLDGQVPRSSMLPRLGLPIAAAVMLGSVVLFEIIAIAAACAQVRPPDLAAIPPEETTVAFEADPDELLREVDLELHRQWSEGVPNRRYAWQGPQLVHDAEAGEYRGVVLEESQPLVLPPAGRDLAPPGTQSQPPVSSLVWLDGLGLVCSLAGGILWLGLAVAHMRDAGATWVPGAIGFACLLAGAYAVRVGHLLWSRIEVQSTVTWLDFRGRYQRLPDVRPDGTQRGRHDPPVRVEPLRLQARVALVRSVFYAAAPHTLGHRVLLELAPHWSGAGQWIQMLQAYARRVSPALAAAPVGPLAPVAPGAPAAGARARARSPSPSEVRAAAPHRPARFCSHCGTPVVAGARFCQHCGSVLASE
jgi:zinc-ribbon domain